MELEIDKIQFAQRQIDSAFEVLKETELTQSSDDKEEAKHRIDSSVGKINIALYLLVDALEKLDKKPIETKIKFK